MALSRPLRLAAIVVMVAGLGLSACGSDDDPTTTTTTAAPTPTTTSGTGATTTVPATTTTTASGRVAEFTYSGGNVSGDSRVTAKLGEQVTIRVTSDVAEEIHVHTYDLTVDLEPAVAGEVTFTADIPGVHEVELEHSHLRLTSLEVQ
ncbi:MAG TPA: hypothetical protein VF244_01320 [Acidimicrobiales bacterium]